MYQSQNGQDRILNEVFFKNKKNGFFIEVGANNGIWLSNTYYFEKELDWKGICIEPLDDRYEELLKNRPNSICVHACAYDRDDEEVSFLSIAGYPEGLSGIYKDYDSRHLNRIDTEIRQYDGRSCFETKMTIRIQTIMDKHNIKSVDYLSVDTEGSELAALKGIDWDRQDQTIRVVGVENNYPDKFFEISDFLIARGYVHFGTIGGDEIFCLKQLAVSSN